MGSHTLLVTGLQGKKCRFGIFKKMEEIWGTLFKGI
jgi:hypothetical protein